MTYDEGYGGYIPGHEIKIDFQDPPDEKNFFYINTVPTKRSCIVRYVKMEF